MLFKTLILFIFIQCLFLYHIYGQASASSFNLYSFHEGLCVYEKDGRYGYIDHSGKLVIPMIYKINRCHLMGSDFENGLAQIVNDIDGISNVVFINKMGDTIIKQYYNCDCMDMYFFSEGFACVVKTKDTIRDPLMGVEAMPHSGYINKAGKEITGFIFDYGYNFSEGLAAVSKDFKIGFIDTTGKLVIPYTYQNAGFFEEGLALVQLNDKLGCINQKGEVLVPFIYESTDGEIGQFSEGLCTVANEEGKCGYIDRTGKVIIPFNYELTGPFSEGMAIIRLNDKYGFINKKGEIIIPPQFSEYPGNFSEGLAKVESDKGVGFIDNTGKLVIPFTYDLAEDFHEGVANVRKDHKSFFIDKTGKCVINCP